MDDAFLLSRTAWRSQPARAARAEKLLADPGRPAHQPRERNRLVAELRLGLVDLLE